MREPLIRIVVLNEIGNTSITFSMTIAKLANHILLHNSTSFLLQKHAVDKNHVYIYGVGIHYAYQSISYNWKISPPKQITWLKSLSLVPESSA